METDESGSFTLTQKLKNGIYYFRELTAPYGYLKGEDVKFEIQTEESMKSEKKNQSEAGNEAKEENKTDEAETVVVGLKMCR